MKKPTLRFVIAGHVDHGKSTLIGRLLVDTHSLPPDKLEEVEKISRELGRRVEFAYLLDHLQEEREQGITIDTTQIFFKTDTREYVIIDAPGHVEFVKNMITGASQAEAALLIVDVERGVQEQTKRHAYLLSLLGITQLVVLLNKMDLVEFKEERYQEVKKETRTFLKSLNLKPHCYIPISAIDGDNIVARSKHTSWYDGKTVLESLDLLGNAPSDEAKRFILPVQDVYKIAEKRIVVGKIATGRIKKGDRVTVLPDGLETTVKTIEKFPGCTEEAISEESIGLTVSDSLFLERGQVVCSAGKEPKVTNTFRANLFWMAKSPLTTSERIILRCATQSVSCQVTIKQRMDSATLEVMEKNAGHLNNLEVGEVEIKTKKPLVIEKFSEISELGRFVLSRENNICAGGIIIGTE